MKRAIINLSTEKYFPGQDRLRTTLFGNNAGADLCFYTNESQVGAPSHKRMQYGFKPFAMDKARREGYDSALWLDASMYVRKDITPLFERIEEEGYFFQDSGWPNERFTTEAQAEYFGRNSGIMISSGVIGLDFRNVDANAFLDSWLQAAKDGMFNGSHEVTRHDQTAASLLIEWMGLAITPNNTFWSYGTPQYEFSDNILIVANGIC